MRPNALEVPMSRLEEVGELAEAIAVSRFPIGRVNPELLAADYGVTISYNDYGQGCDGLIEHRAGRFHIYCNLTRVGTRESGRARFTLGHELGHFFIDDHRNALRAGMKPHASRSDYSSKNPAEVEANHFACNLIMPTERFRSHAHEVPADLTGVLALAELFGTSRTSTARRFVDLEIVPCIMIRWNRLGTPSGHASPDLSKIGLHPVIDDRILLPDRSATNNVASRSSELDRVATTESTASSWFSSIRAGSPSDVLLLEQAISLGEFGVLTLLRPVANGHDAAQAVRPDHPPAKAT